MNFFFKPKLNRISLLLLTANFLSFLVFYIPNYVMESEPLALTYFRLFFGDAIAFIVVSLSVVFLYHEYIVGKKATSLLLSALAMSATNCIFNLPYYYLFETALGNDWIESTLSSVCINLIILAIDVAKLILLLLLATWLSHVFAKNKSREELCAAILSGNGGSIVAVEAPEQKAFFITSSAIFLYNLAFEIVDVVNHLVQYGSFRNSELIFIISKLVFLIALLVTSYVLQSLLYNYYRKAHKDDKQV